MAISRASVLTGHVVGSLIQTMLSIAVVLGVAVVLGFRTSAGPPGWIAAIGLLALTTFAITWLCVAFGMVTRSVETASNIPMFLMLLPFLGSGFVPTGSMPAGIRWFAENQPFTPIMETLRGLLMGTPIGDSGVVAVGWCAAITLLGFLWARRLYERNPAH
jgi:ABC-2 type transport system permease protein